MTVVLRSRGLVFVKTRKTAGTSVELALRPFARTGDTFTRIAGGGEELLGPVGAAQEQNVLVPRSCYRLRDWLRLAAGRGAARIRNHTPAVQLRDWLDDELWERASTVAVDRAPVARLWSLYRWDPQRDPAQTFDDYVMGLSNGMVSNWPLYGTETGEVLVDTLVDYDDLEVLVGRLQSKHDLTGLSLPRAKAAPTGRPRAPGRLSTAALDRIATACAREIALFGWELQQ